MIPQGLFRSGSAEDELANVILQTLKLAFGEGAYDPDSPELELELVAVSRALTALWGACESLGNQFDPNRITSFLSRWEKILGIIPNPSLSQQERQNELAFRMRYRGNPTISSIHNFLSEILGEVFIEILPRDNTADGYTHSTNPWFSKISSLPIRIYQPAGMSDADFSRMRNTYKRYLSEFAPAYITYHTGRFGEQNGTISVAQNSTQVIGTGAMFINSKMGMVVPNQTIEVLDDSGQRQDLKVASVQSNNQLTLLTPAAANITNKAWKRKGFVLGRRNLGNSFFATYPVVPLVNPTVASIGPNSAPPAGIALIIEGSHFQVGATVQFGLGNFGTVTFINAGQLNVVAPPGTPGEVDIIITNPDSGSITVVDGFTYTSGLIDLAARNATLYQIADDYTSMPWVGRASVGTSSARFFNRSHFVSDAGGSGSYSASDPSIVMKGGKKWLKSVGASAMTARTTNAGPTGVNFITILGNTAWTLSIAMKQDVLFGSATNPVNAPSVFGTVNYTGHHLGGVPTNTLRLTSLNSSQTDWNPRTTPMTAGAYGIAQVRFLATTNYELRWIPEGVDPSTVSWVGGAYVGPVNNGLDAVVLMGVCGGPPNAWQGEVGGYYAEKNYLSNTDANDVALALADLTGL